MRYLLTLAFAATFCFSETAYSQVTLNGQLSALGNSTVIIQYYEGDSSKMVTKDVTDGKFIWKAPITEAQKITMIFPGRAIYFFIEPGNMTVRGSRDSLEKIKITGSKTNEEAIAYAQILKPLTGEQEQLYQQSGKLTEDQQQQLEERLFSIDKQKNTHAENYIMAHPTSAFSLNLVTEHCRLGSYEDVSKMYNMLSEKMRVSSEGKRISDRLSILKRSAIGEKMIDFTKKDDKGNDVSLAAFKGKYVLIDFWASWCVPCRKEVPNLIKAYAQYKDHNFTIVSISLDDLSDKSRWQQALTTLKMPWTQLADLKGWEDQLSVYYGIKGIPSAFLIDPNGKIIAKDLRGPHLQEKLKELFL